MRQTFKIFLLLLFSTGISAQNDSAEMWQMRFDSSYVWLDSGDFQMVLDSCDLWLADSKITDEYRADFLNLKGNVLHRLKKTEAAIRFYKEALDIREKKFGPDSKEKANTCQNLFNCFWDLRNYKKAAFYAAENLRIRELLSDETAENLVYAHINFGDTQLELGEIEKAEIHFRKAFEIQTEKSGYQTPLTPNIQLDLANVYFKKGMYNRALDSLSRAWEIVRILELNDSGFKGQIMHLKGKCYFEKGDFDLSGTFYQAARSYFDKPSPEKLNVLLDLVRLSRVMGNPELAYDYLSSCYSVMTVLPPTPLLRKLKREVMIQIADYFILRKEFETADYYLNEVQKELKGLTDSEIFEANIFIRKGNLYLAQNDFINAEKHYQNALFILKQKGTPTQLFACYVRLGELEFGQKRFQKSVEYFEKGLSVFADSENSVFPFEIIQINTLIAKARKAQSDWEFVLKYALNGIEILESLRGDFQNDNSEMNLQQSFSQLYDYAIEAYFELRPTDFEQLSFELTERYRKTLFEKLARTTEVFSMAENEDFERQTFLRKQLVEAKRRRTEATGWGSAPAFQNEKIETLDSLILDLTEASSDIEKQILKGKSETDREEKPVDITTIQNILRPEQTFIEFHWGENRIFVFLIQKDRFWTETIPGGEDFSEDIIRFFQVCRRHPNDEKVTDETELPKLGYSVFQKLIEPYFDNLTSEIIVAPDSWLWYLPFDALLTAPAEDQLSYWTFPYLARTTILNYAHSGRIFQKMNAEKRPVNSKSLLGVAPIFEQDLRGLDSLDFNVKEIDLANSVLGGVSLKREKARESAFVKQANDYRILLLATHGVLDDLNAAWSYIAFTQNPDDTEFANLFAWEISNHNFNNELVILSACETAFGEFFPGEGLISLTRAFRLAGAGGTVSSLWNVDDEQTPELMESFLRNLSEEQPKSRALALAKRDYLQNAQSLKTHPFYWSGFMFIGDDRPMINLVRNYWFWGLGMGLLLIIGLLFLKTKI